MSDKGYESEVATELDANECELTLDIVDKIALRFATALVQAKGYYAKHDNAWVPMANAYDAANDFIKEKIKRDEFEVTFDHDIDGDGDDEESDVALVECYGCNEQFLRDDVTKSLGQRYYCKKCWEELGNTKDDQEDGDDEPVAVVVVKRVGLDKIAHLIVNDVEVATVGSFCPDPKYRRNSGTTGTIWSLDGLKLAARDINEGVELEDVEGTA